MSRSTPYTPGTASPATPEALRMFLVQELAKIALAMKKDFDEIGDSRHGTTLETGMLVWVNRAGALTLDRVSIGAADSGGVGYRLLRVVN